MFERQSSSFSSASQPVSVRCGWQVPVSSVLSTVLGSLVPSTQPLSTHFQSQPGQTPIAIVQVQNSDHSSPNVAVHNFDHFSALSPHTCNEELISTVPTTPNSHNSHAEIPVIMDPMPSHPMITRSKAGIFKRKILTTSFSPSPTEPTSAQEALLREWKKAMTEEYEALMKNQTWSLVPFNKQMKVVDNKWVFRIKYHADGSI